MIIEPLKIPDVLLITPGKHGDDRGFFSETFRKSWFDEMGLEIGFIQDNHAKSAEIGVVRGLHFQFGTTPQAKLVRVVSGAILDVAVDIRCGSPTFGEHVSVKLSADNWQQLLVPPGFAHGYCTLEKNTEVVYKVDHYYSAPEEGGIRWNDPALGIDWPVSDDEAILSPKDNETPMLETSAKYFSYAPDNKPFRVECLTGLES